MMTTIITVLVFVLVVLAAGVIITLGWGIGTYNTFVALRQNIRTQFSNIKTEYQRRMDLFYNLAESVKSYKNFEKSTLIEVTAARKQGITGKDMPAQMKSMQGMESIFSKLLAVFEAYPELKSVEQYNKLSEEIRITEDRINVARTSFNDIVREFNTYVRQFPTNLLAGIFKFQVEDYYINSSDSENPDNYRITLDD